MFVKVTICFIDRVCAREAYEAKGLRSPRRAVLCVHMQQDYAVRITQLKVLVKMEYSSIGDVRAQHMVVKAGFRYVHLHITKVELEELRSIVLCVTSMIYQPNQNFIYFFIKMKMVLF